MTIVLRPELVEDLDSVDGLRRGLQRAIELEHATIPAYLYALYSLGSQNKEVAGLVASVVIEEMSHFVLAANVLNAIGGAPMIDQPGFIPRYPGPLPGAVAHGLIVPLAPFSLDLAENVFMAIEEPETPLRHTVGEAPPLTIGAFYAAIADAIEKAGRTIFTGPFERQVTKGFPDVLSIDLVQVTNVDSARLAIELIVEQGEGASGIMPIQTLNTPPSPLDTLVPGSELAHYYRYAEIVHGKRIVELPHGLQWAYAGPPVPFDPLQVLRVITNPKAASYQEGSLARQRCDTFNYTYTSLLKVLHTVFNGHPGRLNAAVGMMESLKEQALTLMITEVEPSEPEPIVPGSTVFAGPSFEYRPTNP